MAERERGYLGMTHNPFAQPSEGFFERGDRKAYLDQLRHLSQWTRRVLLVTGPQGAGKSILYRQLSASLEPRAKAARVNGSLVNSAREILAAAAQGYGIAIASNANTQLLASVIAEHIQEQEATDRFCVTMVDDAESLEPRALEELLKLTQVCPMRLVLFGDVALAAAVERCARRHELDWHEIRLAGLNGQDARDYLEWRFAEAKYRGRLPFTDQQVSEVVRLAEGFPGRMNQLANVLLAKLESGDVKPDRTRFPAVHRALASLVTLLAGLTYLVWYQAREPVEETMVATPISVPAIAPEVSSVVTDATIDPAEPDPDPSNVNAEPVIAVDDGPTQPVATSAGTIGVVQEPDSVVQQPDIAPQPVAEAPSESVLVPVESAWRGESWLLAQAENAYTIQLVSVSSPERAAAFLNKQSRPADFATYRLARDGRELHVILFGIFDSRDEARSAAENLPEAVGDVRPWVRSVGQVQRAIDAS